MVRLRAENDRLKENWQLINNEKIAMGANDEKKINVSNLPICYILFYPR